MADLLRPRFAPGDPVPWFVVRGSTNPEYHFGSVAGRHVVLLFLGSAGQPYGAQVLSKLLARRELFDDERASLFVVSVDPQDEARARLREMLPGVRVFWDFDAAVSRRIGVAQVADAAAGRVDYRVSAVLLDPSLRVMQWFVRGEHEAEGDFAAALVAAVEPLPHPLHGAAQPQAPVLILPRVFEPAFCRELIAYYRAHGGQDSGYMKHEGGVIKGVIDYGVKRRLDCLIEDEAVRRAIQQRVVRRLVPELERAFRFKATRMERYLVCCYDGSVGGYFRPHRDNDGDGHRQFAVTLNLNAEEYEGGDLRFPEYGRQTYRAPTGGACVFSCGLMHEATPVTSGVRYAFVPFLYDEAAARKREQNNARYVDPSAHYSYTPLATGAGAES